MSAQPAKAVDLRTTTPLSAVERIACCDWTGIARELDARGCATIPRLLHTDACMTMVRDYVVDHGYRKRVIMAKHGFGRGEYKYFDYPLPPLVQQLRTTLYPRLAPIANRWNELLDIETRYPGDHDAYALRCRSAGQLRPTPLILRYSADDYNCLHQDLYGTEFFPLQVAILLSQPGRDFSGGEFVLTEQRPRMQSRVEVVSLQQGDAVVFAVNERPVRGARGVYRVKLRHGVSRVHSGQRHALGVIFHDAA